MPQKLLERRCRRTEKGKRQDAIQRGGIRALASHISTKSWSELGGRRNWLWDHFSGTVERNGMDRVEGRTESGGGGKIQLLSSRQENFIVT